MDYFDLVQWPAMVVTLVAAWLIAARAKGERHLGFWMFLLSNVLWIVWGVASSAWALVVLQLGLMALNIRGTLKTTVPPGQREG